MKPARSDGSEAEAELGAQRVAVEVRVAELGGDRPPGLDVDPLEPDPPPLAELPERGERPGAAFLAVVVARRVVAVLDLEAVVAERDPRRPERPAREQVGGVEPGVDDRARARAGRREAHLGRAAEPLAGERSAARQGEIPAREREARRPGVLVAVDRAVAAVVPDRGLQRASPARRLPARAAGGADAAVEVVAERARAPRRLEREDLRQEGELGQRQPAAERRRAVVEDEAAPTDERAGRVVAAEGGGAEREAVFGGGRPPPGEVEAERTDLLADPGRQRRRRQGVGRSPERRDRLARRVEEEEAGAADDLVPLAEAGAALDERLDEPGEIGVARLGRLGARRGVDDDPPADPRLRVERQPGLGAERLGALAGGVGVVEPAQPALEAVARRLDRRDGRPDEAEPRRARGRRGRDRRQPDGEPDRVRAQFEVL